MDWVVDARSSEAVDGAITAVIDHLRRHEARSGSADLAAAAVREAVQGAVGGTTLWVRLAWEDEQPSLTLCPSEQPLPPSVHGVAGLQAVRPADEDSIWVTDPFAASRSVETVLPVSRAQTALVAPAELELRGLGSQVSYQAVAAALLAAGDDPDGSIRDACATLGWTAGRTATNDWSNTHDGRNPTTAAEIADAFSDFMKPAGGDFFAVERSERRAVLVNRRCPFGPDVTQAPALCQSTSALAGSIAAQANGEGLVILDETIAAGDARCRVVIDLDRTSPYGQHYRRATALPLANPGRPRRTQRERFRAEMSLHLPRDSQSVTLTRHLIMYSLAEIGVRQSDIDDVALAVTEATANVINHAQGSDDYQVIFTVGAQTAEIRVIDAGHGFDHESLARTTPDLTSDRGRGLLLMEALVDQARFASRPEKGTIVHLVKNLQFDSGPADWLQN